LPLVAVTAGVPWHGAPDGEIVLLRFLPALLGVQGGEDRIFSYGIYQPSWTFIAKRLLQDHKHFRSLFPLPLALSGNQHAYLLNHQGDVAFQFS
jgi:hypothetical protein